MKELLALICMTILPPAFMQFSNESVNAITQDSDGALWISAGGSLFRHNGNSAELVDGPLVGNINTGDSTIYYLKYRSLFKLCGGQPVTVASGKFQANSTVLLAEGDSLWIANGEEFLLYGRDTLKTVVSLPDESFKCILRTADGKLLSATDKGRVFEVGISGISPLFHTGFPISCLFEDSERKLWISGEGSIMSYGSGKALSLEGNARTICETMDGRILVGSTKGLYEIQRNGTVKKLNEGFRGNEPVTCLFRDRDDAVWIGTYYNGLRYLSSNCTDFKKENVDVSRVKSIITDNNNLYLFTDGDGMFIQSGGTCRQIEGTSGMKMQCALKSGRSIFAGIYRDDILEFDTVTKGIRRHPFGNGPVPVFCIERQGKNLAIGTDRGVYLFDPSTETAISRKIPEYSGITYSLKSDGEALWIGSNGLYLSHSGKAPERFTSDTFDPLLSKKCCCFEKEPDGSLLFAVTGGGICEIRPDKSHVFYNRASCSLPSDDIIFCTKLSSGLILSAIASGLIVTDTEKMASDSYTAGVGLPLSSLKGGCICKDGDGPLYIGGRDGIISAEEGTIHFNESKVAFSVDRISVNGEARRVGGPITLTHDENNLSFDITSFDFNPTSCPVADYLLEGFDTEWKPLPDSRQVFYSNLRPGRYVLCIRAAANRNSLFTLSRTSIRIRPVWYLSTVAVICWIITGLSIILWFLSVLYSRVVLRERLRNQENLTKERNKMFIDISHQLRTPLTMILGQMDLFFSKHNEKFPGRGHIESSYENARQMRRIISEFVDFENSAIEESFEYSKGYEELSLAAMRTSDRKMLIVDDNREIRLLLNSIFCEEYHILEAIDGVEGLKMAKEELPDIIISDVMMPRMDGIAMTAQLREELSTRGIPLILLTAHASEKHNLEGLQVGADDYITKPFSNDLLKARVRNLVKGRERRMEANRPETPADSKYSKLLNNVLNVIEHNITTVDIPMICRELGMSRTNLGRKISEATGMSPRDYIEHVKLKIASNMLMEGAYNVSEISDHLGFSNPKYFTLRFKGYFGCAPSKYRLLKKN